MTDFDRKYLLFALTTLEKRGRQFNAVRDLLAAYDALQAALTAREAEVAGLKRAAAGALSWMKAPPVEQLFGHTEAYCYDARLKLADALHPPQPAPDTEACRKGGHGTVRCLRCGQEWPGLEELP